MTHALGAKSLAELNGVHPELVAIVKSAIRLTTQDFSVHDGLRTAAEQMKLKAAGASKTLDSKHLRQPDGFGHAVDLVPYVNGKLRWEWPLIYPIAAAMHAALDERNALRAAAGKPPTRLRWGGVWDVDFAEIIGTAAGMERAVALYVQRRTAAGKKAFIDGPHFEIVSA